MNKTVSITINGTTFQETIPIRMRWWISFAT